MFTHLGDLNSSEKEELAHVRRECHWEKITVVSGLRSLLRSRFAWPATWKHVFLPVAFAISIWVSMSLITSYYLSRLEHSHQQVLEQNVKAIQAASTIQARVWRGSAFIRLNCFHGRLEETWKSNEMRMIHSLATLRQVTNSEEDQQCISRIEGEVELLGKEIRVLSKRRVYPDHEWNRKSESLREHALRVTNYAGAIINHHQLNIDHASQEMRATHERLQKGRLIALLIGPLIALVLGWRMAGELQRRVATLAITLRKNASSPEVQVADMSLRDADDLQQAQILAETVCDRIRTTDQELRDARQQVIHSERLAAIGELAAGVAHELRNPLTSIKLLLQHALKMKETERAMPSSRLELILNEIGRMESTIQGLLEFSRPMPVKMRTQDILPIMQRALALVSGRAVKSNITILAEKAEPCFVLVDEEQMSQVLCNVLINSIEAMTENGRIVISQAKCLDGNHCRIEIRDTGPGFSEVALSRLFTPFFTTKAHGTGLGMAVTHRILDQHRGTISASNAEGGGAVVTIELPLAPSPQDSVVEVGSHPLVPETNLPTG